ncbi:hypothetical protein AB7309_21200 [Providencia manganoxydans]|uniref:hypothetical protein n=1 Tax=Providencia TaxID=586 RepID=UPI0034E1BDFB
MIYFILKIIPIVISSLSLILVFITWNVVYANATRISSRSETKSINDEVIKIVNKISDTAISYWSNRIKSIKKEQLMLYRSVVSSEISKLLEYNNLLKDRGITITPKKLAELNDAVTLDCERIFSGGIRNREVEERLNEIISVSTEIQVNLYRQFESIYKILPPDSLFLKLISLIYKYDKKLQKDINSMY